MHGNLGFLFAAFAITWAGFFAYLFIVHRLLADTRRRLRWIEDDANSRDQRLHDSGTPTPD